MIEIRALVLVPLLSLSLSLLGCPAYQATAATIGSGETQTVVHGSDTQSEPTSDVEPGHSHPSVPVRSAEPDAAMSVAVKRLTFQMLARAEAKRAGLPFDLVDAVMRIESDYRPGMIGGVGEIGLMQVRPATAAMLGFKGATSALSDPATNIHYGTTYLGQAWRLAKGNVCRTLMKYRAGHGEETMSTLSATYCARAKAHLVSIGSPLAATISPADLVAAIAPARVGRPTVLAAISPGVASAAGPSLLRPNGRPKTGQAFWSAFGARIKRANARIEARWAHRIAAR